MLYPYFKNELKLKQNLLNINKKLLFEKKLQINLIKEIIQIKSELDEFKMSMFELSCINFRLLTLKQCIKCFIRILLIKHKS